MCNNKIRRSAIWSDDMTFQEKWWVSQERIVLVPPGENKWQQRLQSWDSLTVYAVVGNEDGSWSLRVIGTEYWDEDLRRWMLDPRANGFSSKAQGFVSQWELRFPTADAAVRIAQEIL